MKIASAFVYANYYHHSNNAFAQLCLLVYSSYCHLKTLRSFFNASPMVICMHNWTYLHEQCVYFSDAKKKDASKRRKTWWESLTTDLFIVVCLFRRCAIQWKGNIDLSWRGHFPCIYMPFYGFVPQRISLYVEYSCRVNFSLIASHNWAEPFERV